MNKRHYKVIFSRVLNQLVVVSELAKSQGKAQSENMSSVQAKTGLFSTALSLNPIHLSVRINQHQLINSRQYYKQVMAFHKLTFKHQVRLEYRVTNIHNLMWQRKGLC